MGNPKTATGPQGEVREVMARVTIHASPTDTLGAVAELMVENQVGAVPILSEGRLRGIVTERDLVQAVVDGVDVTAERAADRMTVQPERIAADTPIEVAAGRMLEGAIRHLPVVDGDRVVGMVSIRDLLAAYSTFVEE